MTYDDVIQALQRLYEAAEDLETTTVRGAGESIQRVKSTLGSAQAALRTLIRDRTLGNYDFGPKQEPHLALLTRPKADVDAPWALAGLSKAEDAREVGEDLLAVPDDQEARVVAVTSLDDLGTHIYGG